MLDYLEDRKEYISASLASEKSGYTGDYIGQLCREKKIPAQLVGRTWYVDYRFLLKYKKNRKLGIKNNGVSLQKTDLVSTKISSNSRYARQITSLRIVPVNQTPLLPPLSKVNKYITPVWTSKQTYESVVITLSLIFVLISGLGTLEKTSPQALTILENKIESLTPNFQIFNSGYDSRLVASVFTSGGNLLDPILDGFRSLRQLALKQVEKITPIESDVESNINLVLEEKSSDSALTQPTQSLPEPQVSTLRQELESYIEARIAELKEPIVIYTSTGSTQAPAVNTTILREQILLADTRPTVTRQSDSDADRRGSMISALSDGHTFTNSTLTGATVRGPIGSFTDLSFANATGTTLSISGNATVDGNLTVGGDTTTIGQLLSTRVPTLPHVFTTWPAGTSNAADATIYINPASAAADTNIFAAAVGGLVKFLIDAEGDVYGNNLILSGSTSQGETTIAGNLTVQDHTFLGDASTDLITVNGGLLALASTTLQNFTFVNATGTSATTTNFFSTTASSTNLFSSLLTIGGRSLLVNSSGNVGIGTTTPFAKLTIHANSGETNTTLLSVSSSTASTYTSLFSISNAGVTTLGDSSGTGDSNVQFASDSNAWSLGYYATDKTFRIASSTNLASNAMFQIGKSGTTTLNSGLGTGTGGNYLCINTSTFEVLRGNGSACTASSLRFKENVLDITYGLAEVNRLRPVTFRYKAEMNSGTSTHLGFIAEEVADIVPELVSYDNAGQVQGLDYPVVTALLAKAIQELSLNIESVASTTISISSAQSAAFANSFFENLFNKLKTWLADAGNGIANLFAQTIRSNTIYTQTICVGNPGSETCITQDQLNSILASIGTVTITELVDTGQGSSADDNAEVLATSTTELVATEDHTATTTEEVIEEEATETEVATSAESVIIIEEATVEIVTDTTEETEEAETPAEEPPSSAGGGTESVSGETQSAE